MLSAIGVSRILDVAYVQYLSKNRKEQERTDLYYQVCEELNF